MPTSSGNRYGSFQVDIPEYSTNVRFSVGAASGGGSQSTTWNHSRGGFGRSGDFRLVTRNTAYTLTFYLGGQGAKGYGPNNPGGSGGSSGIASGGNGHRSGGGGGGASGVYDSGLGRYTVIVGGGGGAGKNDNDTGSSGYYTAGRGIGGGGTQSGFSGRSGGNAPAGHRGGGGGGSDSGGAGDAGGTSTTNGYAGIGGNSAWYSNTNYYRWTNNSGYSNNGDGFFVCSFDYAPPVIQYFTIIPQQFVRGDTAELRYKVTGFVNSVSIDLIGSNLPFEDEFDISPQNDSSYTLTAVGPGETATLTKVVDVLIPPEVTLSTPATDETIILGQSTFISWVITGDASVASMSAGIGLVNISGGSPGIQVSPTVSTTYTLTASHPIAGTGSDEVTITVIQPPVTNLIGPEKVNYGEDVIVICQSQQATQSLQLLAKYYYIDGTFTDYQLIKEFEVSGTDIIDQNFDHEVAYNDIGPSSIEYELYAIGEGGLQSESFTTVNIDIDQEPDAIVIPEIEDAIIGENPIISPGEDTTITLTVRDIDIPVEIKADSPIQVEIGDSGIYVDIREI
jgi:hypothetical protein